MIKKILITTFAFCFACFSSLSVAEEVRDSVKIYFHQGRGDISVYYRNNKSDLDRIVDLLSAHYADSVYHLKKILLIGGASPEGSIKINRSLSEKRAKVLFDYLSCHSVFSDSLKVVQFLGRDWKGLIKLVKKDVDVPYKDETLELLNEIANAAQSDTLYGLKDDCLSRLKHFKDGKPYYYMYYKHFPELRSSQLYLWYERHIPKSLPMLDASLDIFVPECESLVTCDSVGVTNHTRENTSFYMAIKTNMLYDVLAIPNVGAEFYIRKKWSIGANWKYGWWKNDKKHWYWRTYGGDIYIRKWFGKGSAIKPLSGHHLGLYGQVLTYDFEIGGKGIMGGNPKARLWDKANWGVGLEYGYSLPLSRRLNLDFNFGLGYLGGKYHEYEPVENLYIWKSENNLHWFGPTKVEISLVWLIGKYNFNRNKMEKGGRR